jgi:O-6-methylguanine DNA methyltransferase
MILFIAKVLDIVKNIPRGTTLTYAEVAQRAGSPNASRAVGTIMKNNYDTSVPCHRVIKSNGTLGDYNRGGTATKKKLLIQEGIIFHT